MQKIWAQEELRDVKPPVDWPAHWTFVYVLIFILLMAFLAWLLYFFKRRRVIQKTKEIPQTAWDTAYERLSELKSRNLPSEGKFKEYYSILSDIVRRYMEERFSLRAPEMTTEEFLNHLKELDSLIVSQKTALKDFLNSCDLVKFAKYGPGLKECEESFTLAQRLVEETKIIEAKLEDQSLSKTPAA